MGVEVVMGGCGGGDKFITYHPHDLDQADPCCDGGR